MNESEAGWVTIIPFNHCRKGLGGFVIEGRCIDLLGSLSDFSSSETIHHNLVYQVVWVGLDDNINCL